MRDSDCGLSKVRVLVDNGIPAIRAILRRCSAWLTPLMSEMPMGIQLSSCGAHTCRCVRYGLYGPLNCS